MYNKGKWTEMQRPILISELFAPPGRDAGILLWTFAHGWSRTGPAGWAGLAPALLSHTLSWPGAIGWTAVQ